MIVLTINLGRESKSHFQAEKKKPIRGEKEKSKIQHNFQTQVLGDPGITELKKIGLAKKGFSVQTLEEKLRSHKNILSTPERENNQLFMGGKEKTR